MSLPITFWGRLFISRMLQFLAVHDPDLRVMCSTPVIFISWLLKHLYLVFSLNVVILLVVFLLKIFRAFEYCMNDLGEPVSARQSNSMLLQFVLTQNSPPASLFNDTLFTLLNAFGLIVFTDDQSSISSFMSSAASASTVSSSSHCCCSFICRTLLVCGVLWGWGVFLMSCFNGGFLRSGIGASQFDVKWPIFLKWPCTCSDGSL